MVLIVFGAKLGIAHSCLGRPSSQRVADIQQSARDPDGCRSGQENPEKHVAPAQDRTTGGVEIGTLKEWDSGRILLDIKLDDPSKKEAHLAALRVQFGMDDAQS